MSDNKRPPGYVPLTIHELAASSRGKKGTGLDYVYALDSRAVDESVLGSSAARAVTGMKFGSGGAGQPQRSDRQGGDMQPGNGGNGGRRRNRRNRGGRRGRGDGDWMPEDGENFSNGNSNGGEGASAEVVASGPEEE